MLSVRGLTLVAILVVFGVLASACGGGDSGSEPPTASRLDSNFDVTAQDRVAILEAGMVEQRLVSSEPAAGEYRFNGAADEVRDLTVGSPVVIPGAGFGIVREVVEEGDELVLRVDEATLGEVIQDGTIDWDYDVSWSDFDVTYEQLAALPGVTHVEIDYGPAGMVSTISTGGMQNIAYQSAPEKASIAFEVAGWEFKLEMEPSGSILKIQLTAVYKVGGAELGAIVGEGSVSGFNYASTMEFGDGKPTDMTTNISGLQGEMELRWAAYRTPGTSLTEIVKFSVPLAVPIPIPGPFGIPFVLHLKTSGRIVPELSAPDSSSGGSWKVTYSSDQGFNVDDGGGKPTGSLKSETIGTSGETVTAGRGPAGWGFGFEFPRFELGIAGLEDPFAFITVDMYSTSLWTPGTTLTADIPPCQYGFTKLSAVAGMQLKILGWVGFQDQFTLWEKRLDVYLNDKKCTLDGS